MLIAVIIVVLSVCLSFINEEHGPGKQIDSSGEQIVLEEILKGTVICQEFYTDADNINGLSIRFATFGGKAEGKIEACIETADEGRVLKKAVIDCSKLKDNQEYLIKFDKNTEIPDKHLRVTLTGQDSVSGKAAAVYAFVQGEETASLYVDGHIRKEVLNVKVLEGIFSIQRLLYLSISMLALYFYLMFVLKTVVKK